jgi:2-polyprenyl-3-methyl-5-hydroxy-6-metoxy-1,4-benzoquinol methylase
MHYNLPGGIVIKTENAAKPWRQKSAYASQFINSLEKVQDAADYGCGKLRYFEEIRHSAKFSTFIDSEIQLSRTQSIDDEDTSVRDYLKKFRNSRCLNSDEFRSDKQQFDRIYCLNVLSTIPSVQLRSRVLSTIFKKLRKGGQALFVVQYRNSEFKKMASSANGSMFRDGILMNSLRGHSFYALISPEALQSLVERNGFAVDAQKLHEGSVFLLCHV